MSQKRNICFYSNKDKWSKAFIEELSRTNWVPEFQFICVDVPASGVKPNLPKWLKQVPTIVIDGDPTPIKTDTEVMNWLYERKMKEGSSSPSKQKSQAETLMDGPQSWLGSEMKGYGSTGYSFVDADVSTAGNGGATIPGNFAFLNGGAGPGDRQSDSGLAGAVQNQGTRSKKEKMFDQQLDSYKQQRDQFTPQGMPRQ